MPLEPQKFYVSKNLAITCFNSCLSGNNKNLIIDQ